MMRFADHAIRRYRQRHRPDLTFDECRNELEAAGESASKVEGRAGYRGATVWVIPVLRVEVMARRGSDGHSMVAITTLPARPADDDVEPAEIHEAADRLAAAELCEADTLHQQAKAKHQRRNVTREQPSHDPRERQGRIDEAAARRLAAQAEFSRACKRHEEATLDAALIRDEMKTLRHLVTSNTKHANMKSALRWAMRGLAGLVTIEEARAKVREIDPGLDTTLFYGAQP